MIANVGSPDCSVHIFNLQYFIFFFKGISQTVVLKEIVKSSMLAVAKTVLRGMNAY